MDSLKVIDCTGTRRTLEIGSIIAYRHPISSEPFVARVDGINLFTGLGKDIISYRYIEVMATVIYDYNIDVNKSHKPGEIVTLSLDPTIDVNIDISKRLNLLVLSHEFFKGELNKLTT